MTIILSESAWQWIMFLLAFSAFIIAIYSQIRVVPLVKIQSIQRNQINRLQDLTESHSALFEAVVRKIEQLDFKIDDNLQAQRETVFEQASSYKQASKLIEMGANIEEIEQTCELSHAEAELLMNLYGYKQVKNA